MAIFIYFFPFSIGYSGVNHNNKIKNYSLFIYINIVIFKGPSTRPNLFFEWKFQEQKAPSRSQFFIFFLHKK